MPIFIPDHSCPTGFPDPYLSLPPDRLSDFTSDLPSVFAFLTDLMPCLATVPVYSDIIISPQEGYCSLAVGVKYLVRCTLQSDHSLIHEDDPV